MFPFCFGFPRWFSSLRVMMFFKKKYFEVVIIPVEAHSAHGRMAKNAKWLTVARVVATFFFVVVPGCR